ncbi:MAG: HD domain-containing protein [Coriobacteriales bacterium]|jgi:(p)ppGpp synthase/HD superfamily hydrolase|nr:HD domain-containing protein [Coriobacteriales bacterium]
MNAIKDKATGKAEALRIATEAHAGQTDRGGRPYIEHPLAVAAMVEGDAATVALLHDVVEDTTVTLADLRLAGFSDAVTSAVDAITRRKGEQDVAYLARVRRNPLALAVKLADLTHNSDITRIPDPTNRDRKRAALYLFYRDVLLPYGYFWERHEGESDVS